MRAYERQESLLRWSWPTTRVVVGGSIVITLGLFLMALLALLKRVASVVPAVAVAGQFVRNLAIASSLIGVGFVCIGIAWRVIMRPRKQILYYARKALFASRFGNPLQFAEGERLPGLAVTEVQLGVYWLDVSAIAVTVEQIEAAQSAVSSGLRGQLAGYAVTEADVDVASRGVKFRIEDVTVDHSIVVASVDDLCTADVTRLNVQRSTQIDLTTSGSMIIAGKTRSGKTTGVLALLLQVLQFGPDEFGSRVVIVDPKMAELSRVPYTVTLDGGGTAKPVLAAMREFEQTVKLRQAALNDASEALGGAARWWELGMHPAFLFLDEFVALRSLFPARSDKEDPDYSVKSFDDSLRRIVTMGASAGCFVMLSIAQANADQIPTMIRDAFSTRVLFRPTVDEARLLWDGDKVKALPHRVYGPGDAWFSSTDGVHDAVTFVHFPRFSNGFGEYRVLGSLLTAYYEQGDSQ